MATEHDGKMHLDEELLAGFVDGLLGEADRQRVEDLLVEDDTAFEVVALARWAREQEAVVGGAAFQVSKPERAARERVRGLYAAPVGLRTIFRLIEDALDLVRAAGVEWAPVVAPAVRGGSDAEGRSGSDLWEASYPAGDLVLRVEVERTEDGCIIAAGAASADGAAAPAPGTSVVLLRDDAVVALLPATAEPAELARVGAGDFRVELRLDGAVQAHAALVLQAA